MDQFVTGDASIATIAALAVLTLACATAGWLDVMYRRIPNWLCALTAIAGLIIAALSLLDDAGIVSHALHMLAALAVGIALFAIRVVGGGDAKFYAAIAAWFPLGEAGRLLIHVSLSGLAILIVWFVYRRIRGYPMVKRGATGFDALPYGLAIGAGAIVAMLG